MSRLDQHFKESLKNLPDRKLSWFANWKIKRQLKARALELSGRSSWMLTVQQLAAVPVALMLMVVSTSSYAFYSPAVVRGDSLYTVKTTLEAWMYPTGSEDRIAYHLWLSDRRYDEVREILKRKGETNFAAFIPAAQAAPSGPPSPLKRGNAAPAALDELDKILLETLQRASKNVEVAFVISDEIREVKKVAVVKEKIKEKVVKQKAFFAEMKPVLAKMEKKKGKDVTDTKDARDAKDLEVIEEDGLEQRNPATELGEGEEMKNNNPDVLGSDVIVDSEAEVEGEVMIPEVVEVASLSDFFDEQLALQDELLVQMEKTVAIAEEVKADQVLGDAGNYVMKSKVREMKKLQSELLADLDEDGNDKVLKMAKVVHEKEKLKLETIVIADVPMKDTEDTQDVEDAQDGGEGVEIASVSEPVTKKSTLMAPVMRSEGIASESSLLTDPLMEQDALVSEMMEMADTLMNTQPLAEPVLDPAAERAGIASEVIQLEESVADLSSVSDEEAPKDECTVKAEEICGEKGEECVKEEKEKCEEKTDSNDIEDPHDIKDSGDGGLKTIEKIDQDVQKGVVPVVEPVKEEKVNAEVKTESTISTDAADNAGQ